MRLDFMWETTTIHTLQSLLEIHLRSNCSQTFMHRNLSFNGVEKKQTIGHGLQCLVDLNRDLRINCQANCAFNGKQIAVLTLQMKSFDQTGKQSNQKLCKKPHRRR